MIGEPPSVLGRVHCKVMESEVEAKSLGDPGALGGSNGYRAVIASAVKAGSETPYWFSAQTLKSYSLFMTKFLIRQEVVVT